MTYEERQEKLRRSILKGFPEIISQEVILEGPRSKPFWDWYSKDRRKNLISLQSSGFHMSKNREGKWYLLIMKFKKPEFQKLLQET